MGSKVLRFMNDYKFKNSLSTAVISTKEIISGKNWIKHVTHDGEDGGWQFLGGESRQDKASVVSLKEIVDLDQGVNELADLPIGWRAWRENKTAPWHRKAASGIDAQIAASAEKGYNGFSVQCSNTCTDISQLGQLGQYLKNSQLSVTTAGVIRAAGGDVISTPGAGFHATVTGLGGQAASQLPWWVYSNSGLPR